MNDSQGNLFIKILLNQKVLQDIKQSLRMFVWVQKSIKFHLLCYEIPQLLSGLCLGCGITFTVKTATVQYSYFVTAGIKHSTDS